MTEPLSPKKAARMEFRIKRFARMGLDAARAADLALRLVERDAGRDDRRLCGECSHLKPGFICAVREPVLMDILQRCHRFEWQKPA